MPHSRYAWHERIKAVEREYRSVRVAVDRLSEQVAHDSGALDEGESRPRDLVAADENLEATYLIRMFAEFETGLRSYWITVRSSAYAPVRDMLDGLGAMRHIPSDVIKDAHEVREYRNRLVHQREEETGVVTISEARGRLGTYLARLPDQW